MAFNPAAELPVVIEEIEAIEAEIEGRAVDYGIAATDVPRDVVLVAGIVMFARLGRATGILARQGKRTIDPAVAALLLERSRRVEPDLSSVYIGGPRLLERVVTAYKPRHLYRQVARYDRGIGHVRRFWRPPSKWDARKFPFLAGPGCRIANQVRGGRDIRRPANPRAAVLGGSTLLVCHPYAAPPDSPRPRPVGPTFVELGEIDHGAAEIQPRSRLPLLDWAAGAANATPEIVPLGRVRCRDADGCETLRKGRTYTVFGVWEDKVLLTNGRTYRRDRFEPIIDDHTP